MLQRVRCDIGSWKRIGVLILGRMMSVIMLSKYRWKRIHFDMNWSSNYHKYSHSTQGIPKTNDINLSSTLPPPPYSHISLNLHTHERQTIVGHLKRGRKREWHGATHEVAVANSRRTSLPAKPSCNTLPRGASTERISLRRWGRQPRRPKITPPAPVTAAV